MNRGKTIMQAIAVGLLWTCWAANGIAAQADDIVLDDRGNEHRGRIRTDTWEEVVILNNNGLPITLKRGRVKKVLYGDAAPEVYEAAIADYRAGNFEDAYKKLQSVGREGSSRMGERFKMVSPYLRYYVGLCLLEMGKAKEAKERWLEKVMTDNDNPLYFEVLLADARCIEALNKDNPAAPLARYDLLINNLFKRRLPSAPWAMQYIVRGKIRKLLLGIRDAVSRDNNKSRVRSLLTELEALESSADFKKYATAEDGFEITRLKARCYKYLKMWKPLAKAQETALREAIKEPDRRVLSNMYMDLADAYYALYEDASGDQKTDLRDKAFFTYLRVVLSQYVPPEAESRAQYRVAKLFQVRGGDDWQRRALGHLKKVSRQNEAIYSQAETLRKEIMRSMKPEAGEAEPGEGDGETEAQG